MVETPQHRDRGGAGPAAAAPLLDDVPAAGIQEMPSPCPLAQKVLGQTRILMGMKSLLAPNPAAVEALLTEFFAREAEREGVAAAYLFGSVARGKAGPRSDVDVAVLYIGDPPAGFAGLGIPLAGDLERLLHRPVDVVVLNRAPADLVHRVLRDAHLLVERDRSRRIAFEIRSRNEYFDLLPHLQRYRRMGLRSR